MNTSGVWAGFSTRRRTLARFNHPNIVRVHNVFEANNTAYMVMEYERGESLRDQMKRQRPGGDAELLGLLLPLCDGLRQTHDAGYIHRDIKPANIFIRKSGVPVLLDFGSARVVMENRDTALTKIVSRGYAPCEQYDEASGRQGPWTDIYALGATAYALISGTTPADAVSRVNAKLENRPDPMPSALDVGNGRFSVRTLQAIDAALCLRPDDRPSSIAQWLKLFPDRSNSAHEVSSAEPPSADPSSNGTSWVPEPDDKITLPDASALAAIDSARSTWGDSTISTSGVVADVYPSHASTDHRPLPRSRALRGNANAPRARTVIAGVCSVLGLVILPAMIWWLWGGNGSGPATGANVTSSSETQNTLRNEAATTSGAAAKSEQTQNTESAPAPEVASGVETFSDAERDGAPGPQMVVVAPGEFRMGSSGRRVRINASFAIGQYEVTFEQYDRFAKSSGRGLPSDRGWGRGNRPAINVSWSDATAYAQWLSRETGRRYRLPSESEWEYAARAGSETSYWWGDEPGQGRARCRGCRGGPDTGGTVPVGSFEPNPLGLFDTAGNVWEWVEDCHAGDPGDRPSDGSVYSPAQCPERVFRGGGYNVPPTKVRSVQRTWDGPGLRFAYVGFRVARDM